MLRVDAVSFMLASVILLLIFVELRMDVKEIKSRGWGRIHPTFIISVLVLTALSLVLWASELFLFLNKHFCFLKLSTIGLLEELNISSALLAIPFLLHALISAPKGREDDR